jgi:hypothetical protein
MPATDRHQPPVHTVLPHACRTQLRAVQVGSTLASLLTAFGVLAPVASADERRFTYVHESTVHAPGEIAYEQFVTWKTGRDDRPGFNRIDLRHEIEFGVVEDFQIGLYLPDWRIEWDDASTSVRFRDVAVDGILALTNPSESAFGSALYGEVKYGDELITLEAKLLLQKNIDRMVLAWNGMVEAEWEGDGYDDDKGVFGQTLGASYEINPRWLVGAELVHEIEYADWSDWGDHFVAVGPNVSHRSEQFWITATALLQVTDMADEPDFQLRTIIGFDF